VRGALSIRCVFDVCELGGGEYGFAEWLSDGRFEFIRLLLGGRFALSIRCVFDVCELGGGEYGFAEWLSDGRFELIVLLLGGRFALGGRSHVLLFDVLLLWGAVA
jgi:hypothetical protein